MQNQIALLSIGRHTRLGDVLERALEGVPFQSYDMEALSNADRTDKRVLFAASADKYGENDQMRALTALLLRGECRLDGAVCAVIVDGEQGGAVHIDALRLLLAANGAGAACVRQPLLESGRDLRNLLALSGDGRQTPFARYCALAKDLTKRLSDYEVGARGQLRIRLATALSGGAAQEWRIALSRLLESAGCDLADTPIAEHTMLFAENATGLPDERTLAQLKNGCGRLSCLIASPVMGGDLYALSLLDQACVRGGYALMPEGMIMFEGMSAVEALSGRGEIERMKAMVDQMHR